MPPKPEPLARLNDLAAKAIGRIAEYVGKRPNVSRETRDRIEWDVFADTYQKAKAAAFTGDVAAWVLFCRDVLRHLKNVIRTQGAPKWRRNWDRIKCFLWRHDWYQYRDDRRICTRCLKLQRQIEGDIWQDYVNQK